MASSHIKVNSELYFKPGVDYKIQNREGKIVNINLSLESENWSRNTILIEDKFSGDGYAGSLIFSYKENEVLLQDMSGSPDGKGLGGFLVYLLAKIALINDYDKIRTLNTAPEAIGFYQRVGFHSDPAGEKLNISYWDENSQEKKSIETTAEWLAQPIDCLNGYHAKWTLLPIPLVTLFPEAPVVSNSLFGWRQSTSKIKIPNEIEIVIKEYDTFIKSLLDNKMLFSQQITDQSNELLMIIKNQIHQWSTKCFKNSKEQSYAHALLATIDKEINRLELNSNISPNVQRKYQINI